MRIVAERDLPMALDRVFRQPVSVLQGLVQKQRSISSTSKEGENGNFSILGEKTDADQY